MCSKSDCKGYSKGDCEGYSKGVKRDSEKRILEMLVMQDELNQKIDPNWKAKQFPWHRAIWVESAELLEHYGWKWWKKQESNLEQVRLELVDIWHFLMSAVIEQGDQLENSASYLSSMFCSKETVDKPFDIYFDAFMEQMSGSDTCPIPAFICMMLSIGMTFDDLYVMYIGKNVLNLFRQDHGYKSGTYRKIWNGKEDNEHLTEILKKEDLKHTDKVKDSIYKELQQRYMEMETNE